MLPSLFPFFNTNENSLHNGTEIQLSKFCNASFESKSECKKHYSTLEKLPLGYHKCPFGYTTRNFEYEGKKWAITGVIAFPRFNSDAERRMAKTYPANKITRNSIENSIRYFSQLEQLRAKSIEDASKVLPQAFHELRKLNGAVIQHAEREINSRGETRSLLSIKAAAELMRNNFDILEALSNIEGIKSLPNDSNINIYDLVFKMKRIFQERTDERGLSLNVSGDRVIVIGSQKSFPIVPAVLLENAIKYATKGTVIKAELSSYNGIATLVVENQSTENIDPNKCFDRGVRFSSGVEGGGFGLFLAKEVVTCHRGQIRCEVNKGIVRMIVELPLHKVVPHN